MSSNCQICLSESPQSNHFGTLSCRACAAFFRRFTTSKAVFQCTCGQKYPPICRRCRMEKCRKMGMREELVKGHRDPIGKSITPKCVHRLSQASHNYRILETDRTNVHSSHSSGIDMYQVSCVIRKDLKLLWKMLESSFSEFRGLPAPAQKQLFSNFYLKWSRVESAILAQKYRDPSKCFFPSGEFAASIDKLYISCVDGSSQLDGKKLKLVFEPYWKYHQDCVLQPLLQKKFDSSEYMALLGLLLWDPAYSNLGEESVEICHLMRKVVLRELKSYSEKEQRFLDTVDTLNLIDRAQFKAQEEIQMCSFYNIKLDSEFQTIVLEAKF